MANATLSTREPAATARRHCPPPRPAARPSRVYTAGAPLSTALDRSARACWPRAQVRPAAEGLLRDTDGARARGGAQVSRLRRLCRDARATHARRARLRFIGIGGRASTSTIHQALHARVSCIVDCCAHAAVATRRDPARRPSAEAPAERRLATSAERECNMKYRITGPQKPKGQKHQKKVLAISFLVDLCAGEAVCTVGAACCVWSLAAYVPCAPRAGPPSGSPLSHLRPPVPSSPLSSLSSAPAQAHIQNQANAGPPYHSLYRLHTHTHTHHCTREAGHTGNIRLRPDPRTTDDRTCAYTAHGQFAPLIPLAYFSVPLQQHIRH